jgi:uncharacterized caspase-like protein
MQEVLKACDFETELLLDSDRESLREALAAFSWKLKDYDAGLLYFAGHGVEVEGRQYLVPSDCVGFADESLLDGLVDTTELILNFSSSNDFTGIVLLDCCRKRAQKHFIARGASSQVRDIYKSRGVYIAFATGPDGAAHEIGNHGIFTYSMGNLIKEQGTEKIEDIFKSVRREVMKKHPNQIPWDYSSLLGDFYFKEQKTIPEVESRNLGELGTDTKLLTLIKQNLCYVDLISEIEHWFYTDLNNGFIGKKNKEQYILNILQKLDDLTLKNSREVTNIE